MSSPHRFKKSVVGVAVPAILAATPLFAGDLGKAIIDDKAPVSSGWSVCDLFDHTTLYEGDGVLKSLKFTGRYHGGFIDTEDDYLGGGEGELWEHRRFRAGFVAKLAGNLTLQNIYNLDTSQHFGGDRFVDNLDEFFVQWDPSDDFYVTIGKQKQLILREYDVSSNKLIVFERSLISLNTLSQKLWGAAVGFEALGLNHELGLWSVALDDNFAWPSFESAGASFTYRANFELNDATKLFIDYQYVDRETEAGFDETFAASPYGNVIALGSESKWGNFGLITDLVAAHDRQDGRLSARDDSHGFHITPYYNLTDNLQLVARYAYASDGRVRRSQQYASAPDVDGHEAVYVGLQYFICGDKLKLQLGHEWAQADRIAGTATGYENNTWLAGVRLAW